mmetsp:Transcript_28661/g.54894  ORF Transcript_28661/g.54894 Transcript_28661/m.54894 type:complete len:267 (-) Transcript_28661:267-1067(-)
MPKKIADNTAVSTGTNVAQTVSMMTLTCLLQIVFKAYLITELKITENTNANMALGDNIHLSPCSTNIAADNPMKPKPIQYSQAVMVMGGYLARDPFWMMKYNAEARAPAAITSTPVEKRTGCFAPKACMKMAPLTANSSPPAVAHWNDSMPSPMARSAANTGKVRFTMLATVASVIWTPTKNRTWLQNTPRNPWRIMRGASSFAGIFCPSIPNAIKCNIGAAARSLYTENTSGSAPSLLSMCCASTLYVAFITCAKNNPNCTSVAC